MKKRTTLFVAALAGLASLSFLTACGGDAAGGGDQPITVVSREEGSGTRGAFIELFGVETKDSSGEKVDQTTDTAIITNSTAVMLTTVAGDSTAIGYASLGSLDDSVAVVAIDGVKPSVEGIQSGQDPIARPFTLVQQENVTKEASDFLQFILSKEGQAVVEKAGYISLDASTSYQPSVQSGKITISGSSSVTPVMEKLKEAYLALNAGMKIEIQQSDSSTGIMDVVDGTSDLGMASRELKDSEKEKGATSHVIAQDGIAVVVNKENPVTDLTKEQVRAIFTGELEQWSALAN